MNRLNAAIIGCGAIHGNHANPIISCPEANLVAVCDINEEKARAVAEKYNCRFYTDYKEMLDQADIDVVHICTPHYVHAPMAVDAMRKGKHVLTEKPMAMTPEEAREMIRVSEETERVLGVCFQNRYNATSVKIKELLESGKAGRILGAKAFVTWHRDEKYYTESGWRGTWETEGGGVLINQAIHTLDLLQWFLGDIESIHANVDTRLLKGVIAVEDTAEATIRYRNGASALFYATNCYPANSPVEIEIICENATIKLSDQLTIKYKDGETETVSEENPKTGEKSYWGSSHKYLIHDFYKKLSEGAPFGIDGKAGIKALEMIRAIYVSSNTRKLLVPLK